MSESITVTLPDGSQKSVPPGSRPLDIAKSIGQRLADDAVVARVNGQMWDLTRPLEGDAKLEILTSRNPEALNVYRHSTAHLLAAAVLELFPETKLGIGPPTDTGFYYDFQRETPFTPEDLEKIEARMQELQAKGLTFERVMTPKDVGLAKYADDWMKHELIEERAGEIFSEYTLGPHFIDFCRGPHVPSTSRLKAFKLLSVAGAYWKGDEHNPRLQRIYGTAFFNKKDQDAHLQRGYSLVYTPHVMRRDLWKISGHANFYSDNMFKPMELDDAEYQLKPMNCPGHILIYKDKLHSYRDLPVRLGELGTVYRYERSGVMHGLMRVRGFTQDDAHIFCTPEQIEDEVVSCLQFAIDTLSNFGFDDYEAELSTWDGGASGKYDGTPEQWTLAENALKRATERLNMKVKVMPDEAAFYGPKIDVKLVDAIGRLWQLSTVQFDFTLPRRFELEYVADDGKKHQPLMVHRALYGSIERFFGILIEHYAGAFPVWLAPVQAVVMPITDRHAEYAQKVVDQLKVAGLRVELDDRKEKVNLKIREAQLQKVPYMLVVGDHEAQEGTVSVRNRKHGDQGARKVEEFLADVQKLIDGKAREE